MSKTLSIITVTYQAEAFIDQTLRSIFSQGEEDFELIIMDGGSKDRTLELVQSYASHIAHIVSEPDQGIYDAMNKGMKLAQGKYIYFLNAGDTLAGPDTLGHMLADLRKNPDVLYGDAIFVNSAGKAIGLRSEVSPHPLPAHLSWKDFKRGMVVCHQSFIAKREISPAFSMDYRMSSDIDWEINCLKNAQNILKTDYPICRYLMGGASVKNLQTTWKERFLILSKHFGFFTTCFNHLIIIARGVLFTWKKRGKYW
ncbi:glycosyltransferase family 2 protein [Aquirufa rosea]|uniref:Glycosyltransferase n=1 Tax=Aquirufa rosea TaxID=2509241 RepID=A0A4Q1C0R8_9BACT|nr:glycosyltransferase family 2 protein [Aquirufa rosea]RXK50725.1 glycosyltransferase [Aquirufa rosea]